MSFLETKHRPIITIFVLLVSFFVTNACSKEDGASNEQGMNEAFSSCTDSIDAVFNEKDGLVSVEFENAEFSDDWKLKNDGNSFSGKGYMVWQGEQHLHQPGNGIATYQLKINNSGTYRFVWKSAVKTGNNGTEHNDTWLRFQDADNFFARKGNSVVYPKDSGKTPNPEGSTKDGWFKIFRSGNDLDFKWNSLTYDNNGHDVFVSFEKPGIYIMEVSARSSGHGIDKFVLFNESNSMAEATESEELSEITCN